MLENNTSFLTQHPGSVMWWEKLVFLLCLRSPHNAIGTGDPIVKPSRIPGSAEQCYFAALNLSTVLKDCDKPKDTDNYFSGLVFLNILLFFSPSTRHNNDKTFLVWINEEDHTRVISMEKGGNMKRVFERFCRGLKEVESQWIHSSCLLWLGCCQHCLLWFIQN